MEIKEQKLDQSVFVKMPEKYKWFAIDSDGKAYGYTHKPTIGSYVWEADYGESEFIAEFGLNNIDWTQTLIKRAQ